MDISEKLKAMIKKTESDRIDLCFKVTSEYLSNPLNTLKIADLTMQAGRLAERVETLNEIRGMVV